MQSHVSCHIFPYTSDYIPISRFLAPSVSHLNDHCPDGKLSRFMKPHIKPFLSLYRPEDHIQIQPVCLLPQATFNRVAPSQHRCPLEN